MLRLLTPLLFLAACPSGDKIGFDSDSPGDTADTASDCVDSGAPVFADADGDGFGTGAALTTCDELPASVASADGDCNDGDAAIHPDAIEVCSGIDEDCDGSADPSGMARYVAADGAESDVSEVLAAGTNEVPAYIGDQPGYAVSATGGTLYLCPGTWHAKVVLAEPGSNLTVVGTGGAASTLLTTGGVRGGDDGSILAVTGATLEVRGVTISGGVGSEGGEKGGGVVISQPDAAPAAPNLTLVDSVVTSNEAEYGGGIAVLGFASLALEDTVVKGNQGNVAGGGLWMQASGSVTCNASVLGGAGFTGNTSGIAGALYFSDRTGGSLRATGCDFGDAGSDDNTTYDIQRQPASSTAWCFGNATALGDTVACSGADCTGTREVACE